MNREDCCKPWASELLDDLEETRAVSGLLRRDPRLLKLPSMRLSRVQDDTAALARVGWAERRLTGGPGPEVDLSAFLDRRDPENMADKAEPFADREGIKHLRRTGNTSIDCCGNDDFHP